MKRFVRFSMLSMLLIISSLVFIQCDKDTDEDENSGEVNVSVTDAPTDNAEVKGVFVTIAEVKVDGETFEGFSGKQTIDIMAYQQGNVKALGLGELEAGSYSNISFVLDQETDADGNSPGCYVLDKDGNKEDLSTSSNSTLEITSNANFDVATNSRTDLVCDFDLRKIVTSNSNNQSDYEFVTKSEMDASVRTVNEAEAGTISGDCSDAISGSDKIVVYVYNKGEYNSNTEMNGQGSSNVKFANAVTSSEVDANGNYKLSFVKEGEYEVHCIGYEENTNGSLTVKGELDIEVLTTGLSSNSISVSAESETNLDLSILGLL